MGSGAWMMVVASALSIGALAFLLFSMGRSIRDERSGDRSIWREFGLSISLMVLFFGTWVAQGIAQWQTYTDQQREHGQPIEAGDFFSEFGQSTLENWQSEFLQLFSFTIITAVLIHKGSAESKDGDDRIEAALKRIEEKLGSEPAADGPGGDKDLHVLPDEMQGWMLRAADSTEPEGYYDRQQEAIQAGKELANKKGVKLHIHGTDGKVRQSSE